MKTAPTAKTATSRTLKIAILLKRTENCKAAVASTEQSNAEGHLAISKKACRPVDKAASRCPLHDFYSFITFESLS